MALSSFRAITQGLFRSNPCVSCQSQILYRSKATLPDNQENDSLSSLSTMHQMLPRPHFPTRPLPFLCDDEKPRKCWLETMKRSKEGSSAGERLGLIDLHPHIFEYSPRTDIIWENIRWQKNYRRVNYEHAQDRYEKRGGGHKPWPQKGMGRARHASTTAPQWRNGGRAFGPRAPKSYFRDLPKATRVNGLRGVLTYKFTQGDLHIVDELDLETDNPQDLESLAVERGWGVSALLIHHEDRLPPNLAVATSQLFNFNVMPVYGFNVFSALKHDALVLSLDALNTIEQKLLQFLNTNEIYYPTNTPMAWPDPAIHGQFKHKTFEDQDWDIEEQHLQMPFFPRGDGRVKVTKKGGEQKKVVDPIPPAPKTAWHQVGEEARWVYQYEDIESESN